MFSRFHQKVNLFSHPWGHAVAMGIRCGELDVSNLLATAIAAVIRAGKQQNRPPPPGHQGKISKAVSRHDLTHLPLVVASQING